MDGRDVGSEGHARAAKLVADRFAAAKLKPLGENGSWFQPVAMHEMAIDHAVVLVGKRSLIFLHDLTIQPSDTTPTTLSAPIAYRGYCAAATLGDVRGKIVVCHGTHRPGLPSEAERQAAVRAA